MQYLIVHRLGVFVTAVPPRDIRQHLCGLIERMGTGLSLSSLNFGNQLLYCNQVADVLEKDFVPCTQGIERMKQSLKADITQASHICSQILYMLNNAAPYGLMISNAPDTLSGFHLTDKTLSPKWRIAIDASSTVVNIVGAALEYKITKCCDSIIEELDKEKSEYHWTRTEFEQQLYEWAIVRRNALPKTLLKASAGVVHNTFDLVGDSIDIAKENHPTDR